MPPTPLATWRFDGSHSPFATSFENGAVAGAPPLAPGSTGSAAFDGRDDDVALRLEVGGASDTLDLMILGDSFTVPSRKFPAWMAQKLVAAGDDVEIVAHSNSGDGTKQGLARLKSYLDDPANDAPDAALVVLGINDALQRRSIDKMEANLNAIVDRFQAEGTEVLLAGVDAYYPYRTKADRGFEASAKQARFEAVFERVADGQGVLFSPDILDGVSNERSLLQVDGLHPRWTGTARMADNVLPETVRLLDAADDGGGNDLALDRGTVSLWFEADTIKARQGLFSKDAAGYDDGVSLWLEGDQLRLRVEHDGGFTTLRSADGAVRAGETHHVAFTFAPETGHRLYLDGERVDGHGFVGDWTGNDEAILIGARNPMGRPGGVTKVWDRFDGRIDDVAIFDWALGAGAIGALADDGLWT